MNSGSRLDGRRRAAVVGRQGAWFVAAGIVTTALHAGLFLLFRNFLEPLTANLAAIVLSTLVNTEFHHRVTFNAPIRSVRRWLLAVGLTMAYYAGYSTAALILLQTFVSDPTAMQQTGTIVAAAIVGSAARFVLLRGWVFTRHGSR